MGNRTALFNRTQPGGVFTISDIVDHPGDIWFVDSGIGVDGAGYGQNPDAPFATLDYAIGQCTASQGDVIYVMPGHAESTSGANVELFDLDVAGVSVIGLGWGALRPTFTLEVATATVVMGAASCVLENIRLIGNITDLTAGLEIEAAATDCTVRNCYFADSATNKDMLIGVAVAADADRLLFEGNVFNLTVGGEATNAIKFAGGCDGLILRNNIMAGDWKGADGAVGLAGAASLNILVANNYCVNADASVGLGMDLHASTTGAVIGNYFLGVKNNTETVTGGEAANFAQNYGTDVAASSGILTPSTLTAWS
jgi:hypothetical protein